MRHNERMRDIVTLDNGFWRVGLVPETGGSIAFGQLHLDGAWVDVLRPTPAESLGRFAETASYPLVPWSNRVRGGRLQWAGRTYQLRVNHADGTAIHGVGTDYAWTVVESSPTYAVLEFVSHDVYGVNFPWSFTARFTYRLDGARLEVEMALTNTDHETFPAGLGHHPYLQRELATASGAVGGPAELRIDCEKAYDLDNALPTAEAGPIRPAADFRERRPLGTEFVDDCYTSRTGPVAGSVTWPDALQLDLEADDVLGHVVCYIPQERPYFALEPVSNANDAFTLDAAGVPGTGLRIVQPGETLTAAWALAATPLV